MSFSFFDHTGDIGIRLTAATLEALFADAASAFTTVLTDPSAVRPAMAHPITLEAPALDLLLADWLGELLHLFDARDVLVHHAEVKVRQAPSSSRLEASVFGEPLDPDRHGINVLVKGITYHQLAVDFVENQWCASVILDI
jgi:SHS2 domain-containing protein